MIVQEEDYLSHTGIKGMKWGVRKDRDIIIKKGKTLHRMSSYDEKILRDHAYVSYKGKDNKAYRTYMKDILKSYNKPHMFDLSIKAKKDLISPSQKKRVDTFIELYSRDKQHIQTELIKVNPKVDLTKMSKDEIYKEFIGAMVGSKYLRDNYNRTLKEKGYNMIVDDWDAGNISERPLLIFEANNNLTIMSSKKIKI
jgi:hypothetical protein